LALTLLGSPGNTIGFQEKLLSSLAQATQGRFKQIEAPPLLARKMESWPNHTKLDFTQRCFKELFLHCTQNFELKALALLEIPDKCTKLIWRFFHRKRHS